MEKTTGEKMPHNINPAAFKLLENGQTPMVQFTLYKPIERRKLDCELCLTPEYAQGSDAQENTLQK